MDYGAFYAYLAQLAATDLPPRTRMAGLIDYARRLRPGLNHKELRAIHWAVDARGVQRWLSRVFQHEPPPPSVNGLWFGLFTGVFDDGAEGFALALSGCGRHPAPRWFEAEMTWVPTESEAPSSVLRSFTPDYEDEDSIIEQVVVQGYAALAVCAALRALPPLARGPLAVAFGFNAGDALLLGELDAAGWHGDLRVA